MEHQNRSISRRYHRPAILVMAVAFALTPVLARAQMQLQVSEQSSQSQPYIFSLGCYYTITGWPGEWVWARIDLFIDGVRVDGDYQENVGEINGAVTLFRQATTQNQDVLCTATSNVGYGSANGYLPGIPDGEVTSSGGWAVDTLHRWNQTLTPFGGPYAGRSVTERNPGGGGPDTCYFPGSRFLPAVSITGGTWPVDSNNGWGADYVGWTYAAVLYYREQGRAPCETTFGQDMEIDVPGGNPPAKYTTNVLAMGMTNTTVWSQRAGQYAERIWP